MASRQTYNAAKDIWLQMNADDFRQNAHHTETDAAQTRLLEGAHMCGLDSLLLLQREAEDYESKLGIQVQWMEHSEEWKWADRSMAEVEYEKAINCLEGLVVARMFELSKMNQAGTGELFRSVQCLIYPHLIHVKRLSSAHADSKGVEDTLESSEGGCSCIQRGSRPT